MPLTPTERKRKQIERERIALRQMPDATYPFLDTPFYDWLAGTHWESAEASINAAGMEMPLIQDDSGPRSHDGTVEQGASEAWHPYAGYEGSLGRAESMIDYLLEALSQMTLAINIYKVEQLDARIAELQVADLSNEEKKRTALADIVRLTKMKEHLDKTVRISLPQWKVKGI